MLTNNDLAALRAAQADLLPDLCQVRRRVETKSGTGQTVYSWPAVTHTYAARLASRGAPREYIERGAALGQQVWMVTLAQGADVMATDRLVIDGRTLEILGRVTGGEWETAVRLACVETG